MKFIEDKNGIQIPVFTDREKLVVSHFILNGNHPRYPTKIEDEMNGKISRQRALEICRDLHENEIFDSKMRKVRRQKHKTEWFYLREDYNTLYKITYSFLSETDMITQFEFLNSNYVQNLLDIEFINECFLRLNFSQELVHVPSSLPDSDKRRYIEWYKQEAEKNGKIFDINEEDIGPSELDARMEEAWMKGELEIIDPDKLDPDTPIYDVLYLNADLIFIKLPFFPKSFDDKTRNKIMQEYNKGHPTDLYSYRCVIDHYENNYDDQKSILEQYLVLIQISPSALRDILYFNIDEEKSKLIKNEETLYQSFFYLIDLRPNKTLLPRLIINTVYDLSRCHQLPENSIVKRANVLYNRQTRKLEQPSLKIDLEDGREYSFPIGFTISKKGFTKYRGGE